MEFLLSLKFIFDYIYFYRDTYTSCTGSIAIILF